MDAKPVFLYWLLIHVYMNMQFGWSFCISPVLYSKIILIYIILPPPSWEEEGGGCVNPSLI